MPQNHRPPRSPATRRPVRSSTAWRNRPEGLARRAATFSALGEPTRLAIVDNLWFTDLSPRELGERLGIGSNLLARHLDVLEEAGLVKRAGSTADRRRKYVRLERYVLSQTFSPARSYLGGALFICTHNSARSQIAAALWKARTGQQADSAGTDPADCVHPGAVRAARRAGIDLAGTRPKLLNQPVEDVQVITVCDAAHEALGRNVRDDWWHWSIPDPVISGRASAFDAVVDQVGERISALLANAAGKGVQQ